MIQRIFIKDFILIHELELELREGFTAITGETGAGKSILIGAIGLILGNRADFRNIRSGADKAIVEAECLLDGIEGIQALFEEHDLDYSPSTTLRRELTAQGKSRAFVNDTPVTSAVMRSIGERLVDIHSQHHNMLIGDTEYQMRVLDALAQNHSLLADYQEAYGAYREAKKELHDEEQKVEQQRREQDYIAFQFQQLDDAKLLPNEQTLLEERLATAHHSLEIGAALEGITHFTEDVGEQESMLGFMARVSRQLGNVARHFSQGEELFERLEAVRIELNELSREAEQIRESLDNDPREVERMEARIDLIQSLLHKHSLEHSDELISLRDDYAAQLQQIENSDSHLHHLRDQLETKRLTAKNLADTLSQRRAEVGEALLPELHALMKELGIAGATFKVEFTPLDELTASGTDSVQFLFATNKSTHLQPIREIASGGEISRFMLALKCILSEKTILPTIIFDEIDTGVSGEVAEKLGQVMARMGRRMQVFSITHLPQIAALAPHHLLVEKEEGAEDFRTNIRELSSDERVDEIATMLSGTERTDAAVQNARVLLGLKCNK